MRTLVLLLALGCAHQNANPPTAAPPQMSELQARACESCRHDLELCNQRRRAPGSADFNASGTAGAECMNDFQTCMNAQQLVASQCQGLN